MGDYKKKIIIATGIYPPDIGGPATYTKILLNELPAFGYEIIVVTYADMKKKKEILKHGNDKIIKIKRRQNKFKKYWSYFYAVWGEARRGVIIYAQDPISAGLPACLASCLRFKKFLLKIVGDYAWEQGRQRFKVKENLDDFLIKKYGWRVQFLRLVEKMIARRAEIIITPSEYLKNVIIKWGLPESKIKVIYNAVKNASIEQSKEAIRRKKEITGPAIISVGRMVKWKGFDILIKIMPELQNVNPKFKLFIAGDGPEKENLKKIIKKNNIKNVVFLGQLKQAELWTYMKAADYFVLNTGYEGLSHIIIEAEQLGLPIITTRAGGNIEIIKDGVNGILVEYNNKSQIKKAILRLYNNKKFAEYLAQQGRKNFVRFKKNIMVEKIAEIINGKT